MDQTEVPPFALAAFISRNSNSVLVKVSQTMRSVEELLLF